MQIAVVDSHPIQYHVPWYRELSARCELTVLYAHRQSSAGQARAGYGVAFDWDIDLTGGYTSRFLRNVSKDPGVDHFRGCDSPELFEAIRDGRFDAVIVTGWYLLAFWQAVLGCKRARVPVLVRGDSQLGTPRNLAVRATKRLVYPLLLRSFDGFLSVGARNRAYLEHFRVDPSRIFSVPHGVDTPRFATGRSAEMRALGRARLACSERDHVVLQVGRLIPLKRPMDVLEAIHLLRATDTGKTFIAVFVGAGPMQAEIEARAKALDVPVQMLGFVNQEELPQIYAAADAVALASDSETWGLVVNEGMAAGAPAIVSDAAGCADDMIDEGLTGYSFACGDVRALSIALARTADMRARREVIEALERKTRLHSPSHIAEATLAAVTATIAATTAAKRRAPRGAR